MQTPIRKGDKVPRTKADPFMTAAKFNDLQAKVQKWKTINRPREAAEVERLALMGDFSENVGYQVAKGRLRGLNLEARTPPSRLGQFRISRRETGISSCARSANSCPSRRQRDQAALWSHPGQICS